ncbi:bifunctional nuclease [Ranunculus cassubicifolius]
MNICCSSKSSEDGNGSMAENFNENDEEYVNSSIVEVKSSVDGLMIKMRDGKRFRCVHNNPQSWSLPDYSPHPAIVLKLEDGSDLLLPIIVLEMPSVLLMAAVRNVQIEMIENMGYEVKLVRVTKRVHEAYYAQLYLSKAEPKKKPSDRIRSLNRSLVTRAKVLIVGVPRIVSSYLCGARSLTRYHDGESITESRARYEFRGMTSASQGEQAGYTEVDAEEAKILESFQEEEVAAVKSVALPVKSRSHHQDRWRDGGCHWPLE